MLIKYLSFNRKDIAAELYYLFKSCIIISMELIMQIKSLFHELSHRY